MQVGSIELSYSKFLTAQCFNFVQILSFKGSREGSMTILKFVLAMILTSLWCIYEVVKYILLKSFHFQNEKDKLTCWLHLSFPGIYGHVVERLNTPSFIFLLGRIIAVQAQYIY